MNSLSRKSPAGSSDVSFHRRTGRVRTWRFVGLLVAIASAAALWPGSSPANHFSGSTPLWAMYASFSGPSKVNQFNIGPAHSLLSSCNAPGSINGRGIADDPIDGNLWYSFVTLGYSPFPGDGFIHKMTPACVPLPSIPFGGGPGGTVQDDIGAIDADPDTGDLWVAGYHTLPITGTPKYSYFYKVKRLTGTIIDYCRVPSTGDPTTDTNDTLAVAKYAIGGPIKKFLLSDGGEVGRPLFAIDASLCIGGAQVSHAADYPLPPGVAGLTGIDYAGGRLIAYSSGKLLSLGPPPFANVVATYATQQTGGEDITLTSPQVDHFKCYPPERPVHAGDPFSPVVTLQDQFSTANVAVQELYRVCNPVEKILSPFPVVSLPDISGGTVIHHPDLHLTFYNIDTLSSVPPPGYHSVSLDNQFGLQTMKVGPAKWLAVPTTEYLFPSCVNCRFFLPPPPDPLLLNHFECYPVLKPVTPPSATVTLIDEWHTEGALDVGAPVIFCNPVDKVHHGTDYPVVDYINHLVCYQVPEGPGGHPTGIVNQFNSTPLSVTFKAPLLCVPSRKLAFTLLPKPYVSLTFTSETGTQTVTWEGHVPTGDIDVARREDGVLTRVNGAGAFGADPPGTFSVDLNSLNVGHLIGGSLTATRDGQRIAATNMVGLASSDTVTFTNRATYFDGRNRLFGDLTLQVLADS